ncbi:bifunctional diaminohydroxyphosphoribosylaminopyrimidine deaminase/5-amino-6-(5-phosphoribosylamino)uracil reductase RibD [Pseudaminobacter soli (ex Li et al. 2025)]|uniref:Riboflavin biosynthesis protein RibD n=1 Tax=Pseudaminobacter soli (ex Li et al. 2025) TaxID=1295366 RepID=A0A2P7SN41_9HYPH|nr:bifunctional diaminohydroxyphosphoribosylaminopyrimidine deaminase/5-amino-6-(5-phosphoribosylamino)uracil reductase RibD [Mesorhizobium soli]PSJ63899.1 bifunctional diaminohydroxyphosphoribosylaminopyrimidine deaminase/5-amino-6-(5-phosphoribosylamino)uracil reductase RibD [Mesorhizobium soli]
MPSADADQAATDRRFMAAALRYSRKHAGLTGTNPAVGTLIVRDDGNGPVIVGRGVTALGGRPHAEAEALADAGEKARGATAYVTLEPCAHHGRTPPCANALVAAGVTRVVGAANDPDPRVAGKGYSILRAAGIEVVERVMADEASDQLAGYLSRSVRMRPHVTLKLALSADGMIGRPGEGQIAITGPISRRQVHLMRAEADVIVVGINTALADDPELTVRLPGLESRSPVRLVLDRQARLSPQGRLARSAEAVPVYLAVGPEADPAHKAVLAAMGVKILATDTFEGRIALPELLEDLAAQGMMNVMVEGGAETARNLLADDMVDRIVIFQGSGRLGADGIAAPIDRDHIPAGFRLVREARFGDDSYAEWTRGF